MMPTWDDVLALDGFSSAINRGVLHGVVSVVPDARILEVGSYKGSTAAAMCHGNDVQCIHMVDNHSEFGDKRAVLVDVVERFGLPATIHDLDYFAPLPANVFGMTFNVYFYDGPHEEEHHARELAIALPHLDDVFTYIVDDYSWPKVRRGCGSGLLALSDRVRVINREVYESHRLNDASGYWNGLLVALCEKR
jgi:hypothetical protein